MKLDRIVLVNWGQYRPGAYDMADMTLLTGETGAGKSTLLDAVQAIMTAAHIEVVNFNPGQNETGSNRRRDKTRRTIESFVVGAEYNLFSRPDGAHGHLACVFRPSEGETGKPFTALLSAAARVDGVGERRAAKLEQLKLFIVDDGALILDDLVLDEAAEQMVAVEDIGKRLRARYPKVTDFDSHKKDYLCALYGRFRGGRPVPWEEASNAAKAWVKSIAYAPIGSVHELVRDEILEHDGKRMQEDIARISDLMRQVTGLREEGERIEAAVTRLQELRSVASETTRAHEELVQQDVLLAKLQLRADERLVEAENEKIAADDALATRYDNNAIDLREQRRGVDDSRIEVAARLRGMPAHNAKESLERDLAEASRTAGATLNTLSRSLIAAAHIERVARQLLGMPSPESVPRFKEALKGVAQALNATAMERLHDLNAAVVEASQDSVLNVERLRRLGSAFDGADTGIEALHAGLVGPTMSVASAIAAEESTLLTRLATEKQRVVDLARKKTRLAAGGGNYNPTTLQAVELLRERLPQANVQVLCDLVEPASERWQPAIEGYMDGARFNLIVDPDYEARAIEMLQSRGNKAKVVQGKHCLMRADVHRVPQDSIYHELKSDNPIARAYLVEQYGSVVKVRTTEQLRTTARGLMENGKASGSRTMFVADARDLVFGRLARERALAATIDELAAAEGEVKALEALIATLTGARGQLLGLQVPQFAAGPLMQCAATIESSRRALAELDLTEVAELQDRLEALKKQLRKLDEDIDACNKAVTLAEGRIQAAKNVITAAKARQPERERALEHHMRRLKTLCETNRALTFSVLFQQVDEWLEQRTVESVQQRLYAIRQRPLDLLAELKDLLGHYNQHSKAEERFTNALPYIPDAPGFDAHYANVVALGAAVAQLHDELRQVGMYSNRAKLQEAERSFHDVFTKQFCVEIKTKVDEGLRTLRQLNSELEHLKFGKDRFKIDWEQWEPDFQEYYGFFKAAAALAEQAETVDLFEATDLSPKHIAVRDKLVGLLLNKDQAFASKELQRIADYRNYRRYEIFNTSESGAKVALSTWGTGSGGQLETPAYIVRAAVVSNRMKFFEKGPSLKLLVNDEAFSRVDEARGRAVLRFLNQSLGLQLMFVMPTKNVAAFRDEFDREYAVTRAEAPGNGELDFVSDCDERIIKKDRMRELWEATRQQAREQARLKFETEEPVEVPAAAAQTLLA